MQGSEEVPEIANRDEEINHRLPRKVGRGKIKKFMAGGVKVAPPFLEQPRGAVEEKGNRF